MEYHIIKHKGKHTLWRSLNLHVQRSSHRKGFHFFFNFLGGVVVVMYNWKVEEGRGKTGGEGLDPTNNFGFDMVLTSRGDPLGIHGETHI